MSQPVIVHGSVSTKVQEIAQTLTREQANHFQSELDHLKRQIKSQSDKEKMYKEQITDLKQQLSRCYMAKKTEERKVSNREMQLERKLKALEEELHKARIQLDREFRVQEAKRLKVRFIYFFFHSYHELCIEMSLPLKTGRKECGGIGSLGETKEMATNCRKDEERAERKN